MHKFTIIEQEPPLLKRRIGRQTPPSPALEAINSKIPYDQLRVFLGREHPRPWLNEGRL